jgi:glycosyltransferase involved in cell wall biosynthesis
LRILHLGKFYPPHAGGMERHLADLAAAQRADGHDVAALVHASPGVDTAARREDRGVQVHAVPCHGQLMFAPLSPSWPLRLRTLLREFRPELLHVHVPNPSAFWLFASLQAARLPWVVHWHADIPDDVQHRGLRLAYPVYRRFEHALNRRAAAIVATSQAYLDASRALQAHRAKTRVIGLGLDDAPQPEPPATPLAWPAPGLKLLAVGRLSYYKGFDVLLDALARCPGVSLLLIGEGEQRARLQSLAQQLDIAARVRFAGHATDAELEAAYRDCDLFCLPSIDRAEAFGIVLLEAMRAARAVLASDIPGSGVGWVVQAERTGELVPPRDVAALATALERLRDAPDLRARYGAAGRARWEQCFRIDAVTRQWTALYEELSVPPRAG